MPALKAPAELPVVTSTPSLEYLQRRSQVLFRRGGHRDDLKNNLVPICLAIGGMGCVACIALTPAWLSARREKKKMIPLAQRGEVKKEREQHSELNRVRILLSYPREKKDFSVLRICISGRRLLAF
ncbi:hypothetical protein FPOAC2_02806 [Fusarium poae]|uniref:hypothetical protein n=1 Tax=Fusarium poae TaxID=36050 RepID=UPI001CEB281F|nr:hypothetical protein FPOAC1_002708 [Fusarium poae]KAG8676701.1 hypothetical protein FPOAC1_002708 [Fusarium poae]